MVLLFNYLLSKNVSHILIRSFFFTCRFLFITSSSPFLCFSSQEDDDCILMKIQEIVSKTQMLYMQYFKYLIGIKSNKTHE